MNSATSSEAGADDYIIENFYSSPVSASSGQQFKPEHKPLYEDIQQCEQCGYTSLSAWKYSPDGSESANLQSKAADMMRLIYRITDTFTSNPQLLIQPVHTTTPSTHTTTVKSKHHDLLGAIKHMANTASSLDVTPAKQMKVTSVPRLPSDKYDLHEEVSSLAHETMETQPADPGKRKAPTCPITSPSTANKAEVPIHSHENSDEVTDMKVCFVVLVDIDVSKKSQTSSPKHASYEKSEHTSINVDILDGTRSAKLKESDNGEISFSNKNLSIKPPNKTKHDQVDDTSDGDLQHGPEANPSLSDSLLSMEPQLTNNIEDPFYYDTTPGTSFIPKVVRERRPYTRKNPVGKKARKLHTCGHCSYTTTHCGNLRWHSLVHTTEKPYACDFLGCDFKSKYQKYLVNHQLIHKGEKHHLCDICGKGFYTPDALGKHRQIHGIGASELKCPHCNFTTIRKQHLKRHMMTHTGEKPFKCTQCDYATNQKHNIALHMRLHTGEKPYKCDQCDYAAAHSATLTSHRKRKHELIISQPDPSFHSHDDDPASVLLSGNVTL